MYRLFGGLVAIVAMGLLAVAGAAATEKKASPLDKHQRVPQAVKQFTPPQIDKPEWYKDQEAQERQVAAQAAQQSATPQPSAGGKVVTYSIATRGVTSSNLGQFSAQVNETLNDSRGWAQLGLRFQEVSSGGSFHLILSEAAQVPSFSSGCSAEWSCRVGVSVIINDLRWSGASDAWQASGGSIRDYRHMVVNHEVGHWLGHGHRSCSGPGQPAPIMQQQSIDLQGCRFNPWPLADELWTNQAGAR